VFTIYSTSVSIVVRPTSKLNIVVVAITVDINVSNRIMSNLSNLSDLSDLCDLSDLSCMYNLSSLSCLSESSCDSGRTSLDCRHQWEEAGSVHHSQVLKHLSLIRLS
jgi:hypothetical protein